MPSISDVPRLLDSLGGKERADVLNLYRIHELDGALEVPAPLQPKVARWCGATDAASSSSSSPPPPAAPPATANAVSSAATPPTASSLPPAWKAVEHQTVISVHNRWTYESCNFNPLRAKRPIVGSHGSLGPDEICESCKGPGKCDFCDPENLTSVEPFGRVRGKFSLTAGNAFKSSGAHGLLLWTKHEPHRLTPEEVHDGFETVDEWFRRAKAYEAQKTGPHVEMREICFWNCFHSAGASQIHPHMQMQLFHGPHAMEAVLLDQNARYGESHPDDDLCSLMARVHDHLGLAILGPQLQGIGMDGVAGCWATLTPRVAGGELLALSEFGAPGYRPLLAPLGPLVAAMHSALRSCGAEGISTGAFHVEDGRGGRAWLLRCSNRGRATPSSVDVGSTELIGLSGASCDPYVLIEALRLELKLSAL